MMSFKTDEVEVVPGRSCGECSLCCTIFSITELNKPNNTHCQHCSTGQGGCVIYKSRPRECQEFYCGWLNKSMFDDEWYPHKSRIVLKDKTHKGRVEVYVDRDYPD